MRIATWDIETTHLKPNFGVVLCGAIKEYGKEPKLYAKKEKGKTIRLSYAPSEMNSKNMTFSFPILDLISTSNSSTLSLSTTTKDRLRQGSISMLTARSRKYSTHRPGALLPLQSISISQASLALPQSYGWKRVTMAVRRHLKRLWSTISGMLSS
jgi:hypothetical protein